MPPIPNRKPTKKFVKKVARRIVCKACGDTGLNSKGGPCHPCKVHGRIK